MAKLTSLTILKFLLRMTGVFCLLALVGVFMPTDWMVSTHARLELGEMPMTPVIEYLARSVSLFYAGLGGLLLVVAADVRAHAGVIRYLAIVGIIFSVGIGVIDHLAGLPAWWSIGEALSLLPLCVVIIILQKRVASSK